MAARLEEWYRNMPLITKSYMTISILTTIAVHLDIVSYLDLYLNYYVVYHKYQVNKHSF